MIALPQQRNKAVQCLSFDGVDDYVSVSSNLNGTYSISVWCKLKVIGTNTYIMDFRYSSGIGYLYISLISRLYCSSGVLYVDGALYNGITRFTSNKWYHVVVQGISLNSTLQYIGSRFNLSEKFNGSIDEVRLYNRALSVDEVAALYKGRYVDPTGLVAHWPLNERSGTIAHDRAGTNDGTIYGATRTLSRRRI